MNTDKSFWENLEVSYGTIRDRWVRDYEKKTKQYLEGINENDLNFIVSFIGKKPFEERDKSAKEILESNHNISIACLREFFVKNKLNNYSLKKEIYGMGCRNHLVVTMEFDGKKNLVSRKIENGEFIEA